MGGLSSVGIVTSYGTGRDRIITEQRAREFNTRPISTNYTVN